MRRCIVAGLLGIGLLLGTPTQTQADGAALMEGLIGQATGISRTADITLRQIAQQRSAEIVTTFAHRPMPELAQWNWGEVIAVNSGYADPYATAVSMWRNSPPHWAVLTSSLPRIGCDHRFANNRHWFVCLVGKPPTVSQPAPQPPIVDEIPDTAVPATMDQLWDFFGERDLFLLGLVAVLGLLGWVAAHRMVEFDDFIRDNAKVGHDFRAWKALRAKAHLCPKDKIVLMRGACPICGWKPE